MSKNGISLPCSNSIVNLMHMTAVEVLQKFIGDVITVKRGESEFTQLFLKKAKTCDLYKLLNAKTRTAGHTGPRIGNENLSTMHMNEDPWKKAFTSLKNLCKETKLKEFQFELIQRIIVTKKELCLLSVRADDDCLYCGEKGSIDHSFKDCRFVISFDTEVIKWLNARNNPKFNPSIEEKLFGLDKGPHNKELVKKFTYTMLFMRYYIYSCKLCDKPIIPSDFVNKLLLKYKIETSSRHETTPLPVN